MRSRVLINGGNGQLGSELRVALEGSKEFEPYIYDSSQWDITNKGRTAELFKELKPDFLINCAAYTAVDKAETEKKKANNINANAIESLAEQCEIYNSFFIHISSDYVYHSGGPDPYTETSRTTPKGVYALSKLIGERHLQSAWDQHIILRTSWVFSSFGNNFVKTMMRLGKDRDELSIVADQFGSPTYAADIAAAILHIMNTLRSSDRKGRTALCGTYNFSNLGQTNWANFAKSIFALGHIDCKVSNTTTEAFNAPAPRPKWSVMSKAKIQEAFDLQIPHWTDGLKRCMSLIDN